MFTRSVMHIVRKDWTEAWNVVLTLMAGLSVPFLFPSTEEFSRGMLSGMGISISYCFAYFCFMQEREQGTLGLLLTLPLRPFDLIIAKYLSMYSLLLVTISVPLLIFQDVRFWLLASVFVVFMATVCMSCAIVSDKSVLVFIPIVIVFAFMRPITERALPMAQVALILIPLMVVGSAMWFARRHSPAGNPSRARSSDEAVL